VRKGLAIGLVAATILISLAVAARHELLRYALQGGAGLATGYAVHIGALHVDVDEAALDDLAVGDPGSPLLRARRIVVRYSLRDLLPGSSHRFGLRAVDVDGAKVTLIRYPDGSFNLRVPSFAPPPEPRRPNRVPLRFTLRLRDCAAELREPSAYDASARELRIRDIGLEASVDSAAVTQYRGSGAFEEMRAEPFTVAGKIDAIRGYAMHRVRADLFPARALANYFADTPAVRVQGGEGRNLDARLYALGVTPADPAAYHVSLSLDVHDARLALQTLATPVERLRAHLQVVDNAFFVRGATAELAGVPLQIDGGAYDFTGALTGRARLRIGVRGNGNISALRRAFTFAHDQPISGPAQLGVLVNGAIDDPVIIAHVTAPRAWYRALPFNGLSARVVYHSNVVALAPVRVSYGGIALVVDGTMQIGHRLHSQFALHVSGNANHLPYLDEMLGDEPFVVDAAATGDDLLFRVVGTAASARDVSRLAAVVESDPNGTTVVAPFWLHTERGSLDGGYVLDRPHGTSGFWALAKGIRMQATSYRAFPGMTLPEMPPIDARSVDMALVGGGAGSGIALAGVVGGSQARIAQVALDRVDAAFGGTMQSAAVNRLSATGPWGRFEGHGDFSSQRFVAFGAYRGTFDGLQPFLGGGLTGHGPIAGTVGIGIEPQRILVQGIDLSMPGSTLHDIPIDRATLTLAIEGDRLRIYSAKARAAGGDVVAAGTFALSPAAGSRGPNSVAIVANQLKAAQLRGIGLPLDAGTLSAAGNLAAGSPIPTFDGAVAIDGGLMDHFPLKGNGNVRVAGNAVSLRRILGALGNTYANVDGTIGHITSGAPSYALDATVAAAQIAPALHSFGLSNYMTNGTFNAQLHIAGRSALPSVTGHVGVPAGNVNGLPFIDGSAMLAADPAGVAMHHGSVLVGSTGTTFAAVARPHQNLIEIEAPHAQLDDFNNFFDTGDTLSGSGSIKLAAAAEDERISSSGNIDVRAFRFRNLPIGDTRAVWSSERNVISGSVDVGGGQGMLRARGSIALTPSSTWQSTIVHSRYDLGGSVDALNLSLWLPALGLQALPITGRVSGDATIRGRYPDIALRGSARIVGGTLGPLTLDRADVTLHSAGRRVVVDRAELATSALSASAAGTLGLGPNEPLNVNVHASTNQLAQLVYDVSRVRVPIRGSFESTLSVRGTYRTPSITAGFDGSDVVAHGIPIASLFGEVRVERKALVLSNAGATFARGEATLAGSLPLQLSPLRFAAPDQPISFDLDVVGLDPALFNETLGAGTKLGGVIDAHLGLSGTVRRPLAVGRFNLTNGSYVSEQLERTQISQIAVALVFNHMSATLQNLSARVGQGSVRASGNAQFPNGLSPAGATITLRGSAQGAQLDLPAYGNGTLDGAISLVKRPSGSALLSGNATLSNATLAFAAFIRAAQASSALTTPPFPLDFDLRAAAGRNVRVRGSGYGAGLDIGVAGSVNLAGTLAAPTLDGSFDSTGGTLTYFDRAFRVQQGSVRFNPSDGVLPTIRAVATTTVVNPDPDRARNPYGSAEITIRVDGPIANLRFDLASNPPGYSQAQILSLIAPFGGFVGGIGYTRQGMLAQQQPSGITPFGTVSPIPNGGGLQQRSTITVGQEAFNLLNAQFTAGLLSPLETTLGQGLGLSSINLTLGYYGNVGFTASRLLGRYVTFVYAITFGIPQTQSFGLTITPNADESATLSFFTQTGPTKLFQTPNAPTGFGTSYLQTEPLVGNSGFSLTYQRHFW
jgi:autotransporter translocation and assembly factor TamB